jgi:hypothetical protein
MAGALDSSSIPGELRKNFELAEAAISAQVFAPPDERGRPTTNHQAVIGLIDKALNSVEKHNGPDDDLPDYVDSRMNFMRRFRNKLSSQLETEKMLKDNCKIAKLNWTPTLAPDYQTEAQHGCSHCIRSASDYRHKLYPETEARLKTVEKVVRLIHDRAVFMEWMDKYHFIDRNARPLAKGLDSDLQENIDFFRQLQEKAAADGTALPDVKVTRDQFLQHYNRRIDSLNENLMVNTLMNLSATDSNRSENLNDHDLAVFLATQNAVAARKPIFKEIQDHRKYISADPFLAGISVWERRFKPNTYLSTPVPRLEDAEVVQIVNERSARFKGIQQKSAEVIKEIEALNVDGPARSLNQLRAATFSEHAFAEMWKYHPQYVYGVIAANPELLPLLCESIKRAEQRLDTTPSPLSKKWAELAERLPGLNLAADTALTVGGFMFGRVTGVAGVVGSGAVKAIQLERDKEDLLKRQNSLLLDGNQGHPDRIGSAEASRNVERSQSDLISNFTKNIPQNLDRLRVAKEKVDRRINRNDQLRKDADLPVEKNMLYISTILSLARGEELVSAGVLREGVWVEMDKDRKRRGNLPWPKYKEILQEEIARGRTARLRLAGPLNRAENSFEHREFAMREVYRASLQRHPPNRAEQGGSGLLFRIRHMIETEKAMNEELKASSGDGANP